LLKLEKAGHKTHKRDSNNFLGRQPAQLSCPTVCLNH
jgi:hypothetical protein